MFSYDGRRRSNTAGQELLSRVQYHQVHSYHDLLPNFAYLECLTTYSSVLSSLLETPGELTAGALAQCSKAWLGTLFDRPPSTVVKDMPPEELREFTTRLLECASLQAAAFTALKPPPPEHTIGAFLSSEIKPREENESSSACSSSESAGAVAPNEGLHVPQLDLDALLGPAGEQHGWRRAARRAVRATKDAVDLRPEWMRNAALASALAPHIASLKPYAYVEWNIVGFHRVIEERRGLDRIVSPEILFRQSDGRVLFPIKSLRMMVTIKRESPPPRVGIEFTVAEAVDVLYRIVYPHFVCDAQWHSFKERPWAGISCEESNLIPVDPPIVLSVGVLIESVRPASHSLGARSKDSSSSSLLRRCKLMDGSETDLQRASGGSPRKWEEPPTGRVRSFSDWPSSPSVAGLPSLGDLIASLSDGMSKQELTDLLSQLKPEESTRPLPFQKTLSRMQLAGPPYLSQIWSGKKM